MNSSTGRNVFLTGASSGIGLATAELLASKGYRVWGTTRTPDRIPDTPCFRPLFMKLENEDSIHAAWNQALEQAGSIDVVIQNAGAGIFGAIEDVSPQDAHWQWQVLVEGPLCLFKLAAGHLRPRQQGLIIGVSSLAAELPMPFSAHYSAGKAALSSLLSSLSMELEPFGVRVVDLRPGDILTAFNDHLPKSMPPDSAYLPWTGKIWKKYIALMSTAPPPGLVAQRILKLIESGGTSSPSRVGSFFQATLGPMGTRLLPHKFLLKAIRWYYNME